MLTNKFCPLIHCLYLEHFEDDVIVISSDDEDDEEEQIPTPTVESQVVVVGRKIVYSLIDESKSDEE